MRDKHGMIVANPGRRYRAKGCAMGHRGELRGKLNAGIAHM